MEPHKSILLQGARQNNLKNINLELPLGRLIVVTGLSGSGKTSLAFDTLYAEGQRRYVESLSTYARQFLGRMKKPEVDFIRHLPPAIAIEQKVTARNPRSTVGTATGIYDYLRMLYARVGKTISPISGLEVKKQGIEDVVRLSLTYTPGTRFTLLAPFVRRTDRSVADQLLLLRQQGTTRIDIDGAMQTIDEFLERPESEQQSLIESGSVRLVVDRLTVSAEPGFLNRFRDSIETAFYEGNGACFLRFYPSGMLHEFSNRFEADGLTFQEPTDMMFSFNSPMGACPTCQGFGRTMGIDERLVVPDTSLSIHDGAVMCWRGEKMSEWRHEFERRFAPRGFPIFTPYFQLTSEQKAVLWHGDEAEKSLPEDERVCIDSFFRWVRENQYKIQYRVMLARYRGKTICPTCHGSRLKPEVEYVKVGGRSITEMVHLSVKRLAEVFGTIQFSEADEQVAGKLVREIRKRLDVLCEVGLGYLTLDRMCQTLSGGESQRINLCTNLCSGLTGSLYILDEPSIGLHSRDTQRLIRVLRSLTEVGNTVIVVEHDEEIMRAADWIVDLGPEAGSHGGEVVFSGDIRGMRPDQAHTERLSHTLNYLTGAETIALPPSRRPWNRKITVRGARQNNLKNLTVDFPLNVFTCVTGVSGSGKSTLVRNLLFNALQRHFDIVGEAPGEMAALEGDLDAIGAAEFIDQNPIGRSSRSNPVIYLKVYDDIRRLMSQQPLARQMEMTPAWFSFNAEGGRCETCKGEGVVKVEMQFMADMTLECEECHGHRFKPDVLEVRYEGKNVYDILSMTTDEAIAFFQLHGQKEIAAKLQPLHDVGLGYVQLGQSSSTLSGGEIQRVKLAYFLSQTHASPTLFLFDEPTTGLHFHDISQLLRCFNQLIRQGHSVVVIEHNLDVVKMADHVIDLGPEGGDEGGNLVGCGTPEQLVAQSDSYTSRALRPKLEA